MIQHIPPRLTTSSLLECLYRHTNPYTKILLTTLGYVDFGDQCRFVMICVCACIYIYCIYHYKSVNADRNDIHIYDHICTHFLWVRSCLKHQPTLGYMSAAFRSSAGQPDRRCWLPWFDGLQAVCCPWTCYDLL